MWGGGRERGWSRGLLPCMHSWWGAGPEGGVILIIGACAPLPPPPCLQVLRIPELGLQGGAQLAADVEYFDNVMSALHGSPPGDLLTVQLFAGLPADGFAEAAAQAAAEGGVDMGMLRALAGMRKVVLV